MGRDEWFFPFFFGGGGGLALVFFVELLNLYRTNIKLISKGRVCVEGGGGGGGAMDPHIIHTCMWLFSLYHVKSYKVINKALR